jgi:hypothetical protein
MKRAPVTGAWPASVLAIWRILLAADHHVVSLDRPTVHVGYRDRTNRNTTDRLGGNADPISAMVHNGDTGD